MRAVERLRQLAIKTELTGNTTSEHLKHAEDYQIKRAQRSAFSAEIIALESNKPIANNSKLINLSLLLDSKGIVGTW